MILPLVQSYKAIIRMDSGVKSTVNTIIVVPAALFAFVYVLNCIRVLGAIHCQVM